VGGGLRYGEAWGGDLLPNKQRAEKEKGGEKKFIDTGARVPARTCACGSRHNGAPLPVRFTLPARASASTANVQIMAGREDYKGTTLRARPNPPTPYRRAQVTCVAYEEALQAAGVS
jgi:hypothetical protein